MTKILMIQYLLMIRWKLLEEEIKMTFRLLRLKTISMIWSSMKSILATSSIISNHRLKMNWIQLPPETTLMTSNYLSSPYLWNKFNPHSSQKLLAVWSTPFFWPQVASFTLWVRIHGANSAVNKELSSLNQTTPTTPTTRAIPLKTRNNLLILPKWYSLY